MARHRRARPDEGLICGQALGAVNGGAVGMAQASPAVFVGQVRDPKLRQAAGDLDVERRILRLAVVDVGDRGRGAVDDTELIMPDQETDSVAGSKGERLAVAGRRHGRDRDVIADNSAIAPEANADFVIQCPDLGVGLGDQQDRRIRHHALSILPGVHDARHRRLLGSRQREQPARLESAKSLFSTPFREIRHRGAHPGLALPHDGVDRRLERSLLRSRRFRDCPLRVLRRGGANLFFTRLRL